MLLAVAVNVTDVPAQIGPDGDAAMLTVGVILEFTTMVIVLDVAVVDVKQVPPVTVITTSTVFPFASVELVKVLDAPLCTLLPLTLKL